ncbi:MAG: 4-(cytidine 5'-diphospho)-2-C-methyl-D-erythritol kinase, partial [Longimicrobiales bacterium]
ASTRTTRSTPLPKTEVAVTVAPAKVNLRLVVLAREESGYHQLETVFCALDLADELVIVPAGSGVRLEVHGAELGPPEQNLVYRATTAFFSAIVRKPAVDIVLRKHIPVGAGLGGGSSDAAATLRALNERHGKPLDDDALVRLGGTLGSDVPFLLCGSPLALAWGRGDRLLPLDPLAARPVLLVVPPHPIATAEAYRDLAAARERAALRPAALRLPLQALEDWSAVRRIAVNDFEPVVFARFPDLEAARDTLLAAGADLALLAGSGSAVFGIFAEDHMRDRAETRINERHPRLLTISTLTAGS